MVLKAKREDNGRFLPGTAPGPGRRAKANMTLSKILKRKMMEPLEDGQIPAEVVADRLIKEALNTENPDWFPIVKFIYERVDGKPQQYIEQRVVDIGLSVEDLAEAEAELEEWKRTRKPSTKKNT